MKKTVLSAVIASMLALPGVAFSADFHIAVASNFNDCLEELIDAYTGIDAPGEGLTITQNHDSSGRLDSDIRANPDKYQLFFSADNIRPAALANDNKASNVGQYAQGKLVAYSNTITGGANIGNAIANNTFTSMAVGNPALAPYGVAAQEFLTSIGLWGDPRITLYNNIGLTKDAVDNGLAEIGLISQGQVNNIANHTWVVTPGTYGQIHQDACAIVQSSGAISQDALNFLNWVMTANGDAENIIKSYGYLR